MGREENSIERVRSGRVPANNFDTAQKSCSNCKRNDLSPCKKSNVQKFELFERK